MRYYKECRIRFVGDPAIARRYIPQARLALGEVINLHLDMGGIETMRRVKRMPDGAVFHLDANQYMHSITIDVTGVGDVMPRDIFVSGYSTSPGSNLPVKGWLVGLKYVEHGEDVNGPKKLIAPATVTWSPREEAPVRNAGSVINWRDYPVVVGDRVKMTIYERPLHKPYAFGDYANLSDLGLPMGGPLQEHRLLDDQLYLLYTTQSSDVPDNTVAILAEFSWPGRLQNILQIRGPQVLQVQSLSIDSTYVWFTYQGTPVGSTPPSGVDPLHTPFTLNRVNRTTGAIAQLTYYSLPSTDNITVLFFGQVSGDDGTKFIACRIFDRTLPGGDSVARYHPFAYMNPTNGALGILSTCFWLVNPGVTTDIVTTFYPSLDSVTGPLFAAQNTLCAMFNASVEDGESYAYCLMQMSNTETGTTNRRMIIKLIPSTQEVVGTLIMEDVYIIKIRSDSKDIYFSARLGPQNLSGNMTSGGLRAGLFRIPKEDFFGTVDPGNVHLVWERDDPSTPEDFTLVYTGFREGD
jgi:hypothetical protein